MDQMRRVKREEALGQTVETDPLLALAGTLNWSDMATSDVAFPPEIRVVKGSEDDPDPLLALAGTLQADVTDIGERHDDYIAAAVLAEYQNQNGLTDCDSSES